MSHQTGTEASKCLFYQPKCPCGQLKYPSGRWSTTLVWPYPKLTLPLTPWAEAGLPCSFLQLPFSESVQATAALDKTGSRSVCCTAVMAALTWERQSCHRIPQCNGGTAFWLVLHGSLKHKSHEHQHGRSYIKSVCKAYYIAGTVLLLL